MNDMNDNTFIASMGSVDKKITEWKKEPTLSELKVMFTDAKTHHSEQLAKIEEWDTILKAPNVEAGKDRSRVQPKLVRKQAEWRYAALSEPFLGSDRLFKVDPVTFEDEEAAKQNELLLNWQFRTKLNRVKLIDDFVRATVDEGTSILRLGWVRETTTVTENKPVFGYYPVDVEIQEQYMGELQELAQMLETNPREFEETLPDEVKEAVHYFVETGVPTEVRIEGYTEVEEEKVLKNHPTVDVLNPNDIYIDPTCNGDMDKALFAVYVFDTSKYQLMNEPDRYHNLDKINWGDTNIDSERYNYRNTNFRFQDEKKSKVTAYEYWGYHDINDDGHMVPIVATWVGDVLIRLEESPFPDGKLPFVVVPYLPVKRELFGETDAELLKDNQAIAGAVVRSMIDTMGRGANAQTCIPKGWLDVVNHRRFLSGQDYEYNPNMHPGNAVFTHTTPELPNSTMNMLNLQHQEAESLSGIKSFSGGISGSAYGDVAAGIRGALDASSKREMAILRRLAKGMVEIGNKIIAMNAVFLSDKEVVRVTNRKYVEIRREDLAGNFDLIVDISTAEIDDNKAQDLSFMVQTVGPIAGPEASMMLIAEIADLKRMPALAQRLREFSFEPSPEEQQQQQIMAELEMQKAQLEIAELESKIIMNNAIAASHGANTEAKIVDTESVVSGLAHEREMEKQKAQSQGNQNLAITKALVTNRKPGDLPPNIDAALGHVQLTELSSKYSDDDLKDNQHSVRPVNNNELL